MGLIYSFNENSEDQNGNQNTDSPCFWGFRQGLFRNKTIDLIHLFMLVSVFWKWTQNYPNPILYNPPFFLPFLEEKYIQGNNNNKVWWLMLIFNLNAFISTMEIYLQLYLWKCVQRVLARRKDLPWIWQHLSTGWFTRMKTKKNPMRATIIHVSLLPDFEYNKLSQASATMTCVPGWTAHSSCEPK